MNGNKHFRGALALLATAAALALPGCGGSDDDAGSTGGGGGASTLTFSAANPAAHNTSVDVAAAKTVGNDARAADAFSAAPYCDVYYEDATAANGKHYALQVYFRQSDKAPLHASLIDATTGAAMWVAFHNDGGKPITGITVDTTARTLTFASKELSGTSGEKVTISGTASFPKNSTSTAGCGA